MSDESRGLNKWQLALAVGIGAAAVVGVSVLACVALRGRRSSAEIAPQENSDSAEGVVTGALGGETKTETKPKVNRVAYEIMVKIDYNQKICHPSLHLLHPSLSLCTQGQLERALDIKQQGNDFFKQQKYEEAIGCYEEGIGVCPSAKKEEIAKFHQNIAAVYDKMVCTITIVGGCVYY